MLSRLPKSVRFIACWLAATTIAIAVGTQFSLLSLGLTPLLLGLLQWLVLRSQVRPVWAWWPLTVVGGMFSFGVGFYIYMALMLYLIPREMDATVRGLLAASVGTAVAGALVGFAQWIVLRRYVQRASWWVGISAIAITLGSAWVVPLGEQAVVSPNLRNRGEWAAIGLLSGVIGGGIKGAGLWWLLQSRRSRPSESALPSEEFPPN